MTKKNFGQRLLSLLKGSISGFFDDKVFKLSAALAYYTVFSMGPMILIVILLCSVFFGKEAIEGRVYQEISAFVGLQAAGQVENIIKHAAVSGSSTLAAIIGIATLVFGATGVFVEIQDSINFIWGLKAKPKKGWLKLLLNRVLSFSLVIGLGFILMVSLLLDRFIDYFNERLFSQFPQIEVLWAYSINTLLNFIIAMLLFGSIFKVLPDARIKWKDVVIGAGFTAILFLIGKFGISYYLGQMDITGSYGVAGSIIILLLWVYYSAAILYFGAEFTLQYAQQYGKHIYPNSYAVWIEKVEIQHQSSLESVSTGKQVSPEEPASPAESSPAESSPEKS